MLNKLERDRVQWARDALDEALSFNADNIHDHTKKQERIRYANEILRKLMDVEYSSKNY